MLTTIREHSRVRLRDGREGTVMHVHVDAQENPVAYMVDTGGDFADWPSVTLDQIKRVLWEPEE